MKLIKALDIEFENCEIIHLAANVLGDIYLKGFFKCISRIASNAIAEQEYIKTVALEIFNEAEECGEWVTDWGDWCSKLKRIEKYNDITGITIYYIDDTKQTYYVDYETDSDEIGAPNINQMTYRSSLGNLYVVISKKYGVFDFYDKKVIEDKKRMDFKKKMYMM